MSRVYRYRATGINRVCLDNKNGTLVFYSDHKAALSEAQARIAKLEWLVEVQDFAFYLEYERKHLTTAGNVEFEAIDQAARAATEASA